ncbi:MAG: LPS export ABC transporter permease LptF [Burkholderiaceae bacterium]
MIFATLFTIMVTTTLIRILGRASNGKVDSASVLPLIAFSSVNYLPVLLILTLYVSVLVSLTRAYQDSEMVIWFASGQSLGAWIRPVLGFALPFVVVSAAIAFGVAPWANRQASDMRKQFENREDIAQVAPGQFRESASANRVFFVEALSNDQTMIRNVFVTQSQGQNVTVVVSRGGRLETHANGDRFIVLENGRRYDGAVEGAEFKLMEFARYGVLLDNSGASGAADDSTKILDTTALIGDPTRRNLAELMWRISLPVSAVVLALLAIPMSAFNPRAGRSINLVLALLIYVVYNNLLSLAQGWIAQGKLPFGVGVSVVHLAFAALVVWLFYRRMTLVRWRLPWRRAAPAVAAPTGGRAGA